MKALLYKQFQLVAHPMTYVFCLFGVMLLIPSYPYTVAYFYVTLGLFFAFMNAREQRDSDFTALLPVSKSDIVKSTFLFTIVIEIASIIFSIPFVIISSKIRPLGGNAAGIDANIAILGVAFLIYAIFNIIYFTSFYRSGYKVGASFLKASIAIFLVVAGDVVSPHIITWLDGYDSRQWLILGAGVVLFSLLSYASCKKSITNYEKIDL